MKPPRVLALTIEFGRPWERSRATFNQILFDRFSKRFDLTVLVPVPWHEWYKHKGSSHENRQLGRNLWPHAIYFPYFYIPRISRPVNSVFMLFSLLFSCPRLVLFSQWDAFFGSWIFPDSVSLGWLGLFRRIPYFAAALGTDVNEISMLPLQRFQIVKTLNRSSGVFSVSRALSEKLIQLGVSKKLCHVIYNGVETSKFSPGNKLEARVRVGLEQNQKVILFVGHLIDTKGVFELLSAFQQMVLNDTSLTLIFVGDGADADKLKKQVVSRKLSASVRFAGTVLHDQIADWFRAADVFALPSYREGVPNVLMEAMSCGLPIVTTNVGGIPEVLPEFAGVMVEPKSVEALRQALEEALVKTFDHDRIVEHASHFTWEQAVAEYETQIRLALESNSPAPRQS
jgi:glycosyltransferase involved in cell wall biosynthesis